MRLPMIRWVFLAVLACSSAYAEEQFCTPFNGPMRWVGDVASDAKCTDDDIQSAIKAVADNPSSCPATIFITREHTYTAQHLTISNTGKSIKLEGQGDGVMCGTGESICIEGAVCPVAPVVTLSGSGHTGDSVIHIDGTNNITLKFLTVSQGTLDSDQGGGGIYFNGNGSLTIDRSVISFNTAGYGGGIDFIGSGGNATLSLAANTQILSNTALVDGGGIRTEGTARLFALQDQTLIAFNHADNGHGGGLDVIAPSRADIGSSGFSSLGVIYENTAAYGGGISVNDGGDHGGSDATVRLFTTNGARPVRVSSNTASTSGGGVYLKSASGFDFTLARACFFDFLMDENTAPKGAAIHGDFDSDILNGDAISRVSINATDDCGPESRVALGGVACATGVDCNDIFANIAAINENTLSGPVVTMDHSVIDADRFILHGNSGTQGLYVDAGGAHFTNCLITNNTTQGEIISSHDVSPLEIDSCTIAGNTIINGYVISGAGTTVIERTIIDQPSRATYDQSSGTLHSEYILSLDSTGLTSGSVKIGTPTFVDAAHGDYHLAETSLGIDYAPAASTGSGLDLDGNLRTMDLLPNANVFGPQDLGAYERPTAFTACGASDTIFCNGFEP